MLCDLIAYTDDSLNLDATLNDAFSKMKFQGITHVVVVDHFKPVGILTLKDIVTIYVNGVDENDLLKNHASFPVITIRNNRPVDMAVEMMIDYDIRRIVLTDEVGNYASTLTQFDVLKYYESQMRTADEVHQCLNRNNRAIGVESGLSVGEAILTLRNQNRDVLLINGEDGNPIGIITEHDLIDLVLKKIPSNDPIVNWMHSPIISVDLNTKIHDAMEIMKERKIRHLLVTANDQRIYVINERDLVLNYSTPLEMKLESKLRDAKATYNIIGLIFCEIIDIGDEYVIKWLNAEAMMTFQVRVDDPVTKMLPKEVWDKFLVTFRRNGGVEREQLVLGDKVYEVTLVDAEVNGYPFYKLFMKDVTELVRLSEELRLRLEGTIDRMTHYDPLTDLPNRLLLKALLEHSIQKNRREKTKIGVLYVDIDNFKDINESYGYRVGDVIIKRLAEKLSNLIRPQDTIARIGGDEFVVILDELASTEECEDIIRQIIDLFTVPFDTEEGKMPLSVSVGITLFPDDAEDGENLIKNADIALRRAKEEGHNAYCFYSHEMSVQLFQRVIMERELRRAIEEKEFIVYYQPQLDLKSGALVGAEALVRWRHPSMGIVSPNVFIPLAEANNLIVPIGEEVLLQACIQAREWKEQGLFPGKISVNVSGKQFGRSDMVETIAGIIEKSGLKPCYVELEITESVLMNNPKLMGKKLVELKHLGIEVAIDDFGTGYSSLSYLKTFPIDKLKIDQSFVRGLPDDGQDRAIIKAIIAMADALGIKTIAEGIETESQKKVLETMGCMQAQGYFFGRPESGDKFVEFLKYNETMKSKG